MIAVLFGCAIALGAAPGVFVALLATGLLEWVALRQLRKPDFETRPVRLWLGAAALLTLVAVVLLLAPGALDGHVKSCFECDGPDRDGRYNFFGAFIAMYLFGAIAGVLAAITWGVSLTRLSQRVDEP